MHNDRVWIRSEPGFGIILSRNFFVFNAKLIWNYRIFTESVHPSCLSSPIWSVRRSITPAAKMLNIELLRLDLPHQTRWNIGLHMWGMPRQSWTDLTPLQAARTNGQASTCSSTTLKPSSRAHPNFGPGCCYARWGHHRRCRPRLTCFCNF